MDDFTIYDYLKAGISPLSIKEALSKDHIRIINDFEEENIPPSYKEALLLKQALVKHHEMLRNRKLPPRERSLTVDQYWQCDWHDMGDFGPDTPHIFTRAWVIGKSKKRLQEELAELDFTANFPLNTHEDEVSGQNKSAQSRTQVIQEKAKEYVREIAIIERDKSPEKGMTHNHIARKIMDDPKKMIHLQNNQGRNYSYEWLLKIAREVIRKDFEELFLDKRTKR